MFDDTWARFVGDLTDRLSGPMKVRFVLQPVMSMVFATMAGLKDAKLGKSPYFWGMVTDPSSRADMLMDGWKSVGKVFVLALGFDVVYQFIVLHLFYPGEAILVALLLSIVPYLLVRGLVTRLVSRK